MQVERKDPTSIVIIVLGIIIGVGGFLILNNSNDNKQMKVVRPTKPSDGMMIKKSDVYRCRSKAQSYDLFPIMDSIEREN